jgi:hypothetical protein
MIRRRKIVEDTITVCTKVDVKTVNEFDRIALRLSLTRGGLLAMIVERTVSVPGIVEKLEAARADFTERLIRYKA